MTTTHQNPDLRRIGEHAVAEVCEVLLSLKVTVQDSSDQPAPAPASNLITSAVGLSGQRISGVVALHFSQAFVASAFRILTGLSDPPPDATPLLDDTAGELTNMAAGRVAAQLAVVGYSCDLGTPRISHGGGAMLQSEPGADHARAEFLCEGHSLSLEVLARYTNP